MSILANAVLAILRGLRTKNLDVISFGIIIFMLVSEILLAVTSVFPEWIELALKVIYLAILAFITVRNWKQYRQPKKQGHEH